MNLTNLHLFTHRKAAHVAIHRGQQYVFEDVSSATELCIARLPRTCLRHCRKPSANDQAHRQRGRLVKTTDAGLSLRQRASMSMGTKQHKPRRETSLMSLSCQFSHRVMSHDLRRQHIAVGAITKSVSTDTRTWGNKSLPKYM